MIHNANPACHLIFVSKVLRENSHACLFHAVHGHFLTIFLSRNFLLIKIQNTVKPLDCCGLCWDCHSWWMFLSYKSQRWRFPHSPCGSRLCGKLLAVHVHRSCVNRLLLFSPQQVSAIRGPPPLLGAQTERLSAHHIQALHFPGHRFQDTGGQRLLRCARPLSHPIKARLPMSEAAAEGFCPAALLPCGHMCHGRGGWGDAVLCTTDA